MNVPNAPVEPSSAPVGVDRPRSRFAAILTYTLRSCVPPRRWVLVLAMCVGAVLFGLLARVIDVGVDEAFANIAAEGLLSLVVPIAALVIGDAVLGAEIRAGTFLFTWMTPVPVWQIALGRWLGGVLVGLVTIVPATGIAAVVAGSSGSAGPVMIATAMAVLSYVAVFIAIGCLTRRTAVWSLAFVFLIERLLGAALSGIAQLSPTWMSRAIFVGLVDDPPSRLMRDGVPEGGGAVVRLAIITVVALAVATWRMRSLKLTGAAD